MNIDFIKSKVCTPKLSDLPTAMPLTVLRRYQLEKIQPVQYYLKTNKKLSSEKISKTLVPISKQYHCLCLFITLVGDQIPN